MIVFAVLVMLWIYNKIYTMVFFYISAPLLLGSRQATIKELRQSVVNRGLAKGGELNISFDKLKTQNLDTLMFSNDKSLRLQNGIQALLKRIDRQYFDLSDKDNHRWWVKGEKELPVQRYFSEFIWNESKYPKGKEKEKENKQQKFSIPILISLFQTKFLTVENLLKMNTNQYNEAKVQLNQITQKEGNYNVKDLSQVIAEPNVTAKHFHNTKFVTTVVCVVPTVMIDHFQRNFWRVSNYVIPESAKKLNVPQKDGLTLWTVDLFTQKIDQYEPHSQSEEEEDDSDLKKDAKKQHRKHKVYQSTIAQFIDKARESLKITVREFKFESGQNEQRKKKREALTYKFQAHTSTLKEVLKTQFSQAYELYIHTKMIRMVIQSRMRFGNDKTVLYYLQPASNKEKAVQSTLIQIFGDKQSQGLYGTKDQIDDGQDFFPFIYVPGLTF